MSCSLKNQTSASDTQAIDNFREYLKIQSVHPNVNYDDCLKFLEKQANRLNLPIQTHYVVPQKPIVIITWMGTEPSLPSILLNSHMDVVPVFEEKWTQKPFAADIIDGKIYGRGTQDMKSVGIQYLEAVKRLKENRITLKRTVHISFVPDEEIGGGDGMKAFVKTDAFQNLNVGVALDESCASPVEEFVLFYGERYMWHFHIHCPGNPGHGSLLLENTAGEKVSYILNKFFKFRDQQIQLLKDNPSLIGADVTALNLTKISGGVQTNVIPPEFVLSFDCRIPTTVDVNKWEATINQWCKEAGEGVWVEYELKQFPIAPSKIDNTNIFWVALKEAIIDRLKIKVKPQICGGATDARYVRSVGIPAYGFSPMNNTPVLLHGNDEFISVDTFLKGIKIYYEILISLGNKIK